MRSSQVVSLPVCRGGARPSRAVETEVCVHARCLAWREQLEALAAFEQHVEVVVVVVVQPGRCAVAAAHTHHTATLGRQTVSCRLADDEDGDGLPPLQSAAIRSKAATVSKTKEPKKPYGAYGACQERESLRPFWKPDLS